MLRVLDWSHNEGKRKASVVLPQDDHVVRSLCIGTTQPELELDLQ
jgi:hypothetical protein